MLVGGPCIAMAFLDAQFVPLEINGCVFILGVMNYRCQIWGSEKPNI